MRAARLRESPVRFHFHRVHEVGELDCILDEEDRDVVSDQIPITFRV